MTLAVDIPFYSTSSAPGDPDKMPQNIMLVVVTMLQTCCDGHLRFLPVWTHFHELTALWETFFIGRQPHHHSPDHVWHTDSAVSCEARYWTRSQLLCTTAFRLVFPSVLWHCWLGDRKGIQPVKTGSWLVDDFDLSCDTSYSISCYLHIHHPIKSGMKRRSGIS